VKNISFVGNVRAFEFKDLSDAAQGKVLLDMAKFWLAVRKYNKDNKGNFERAIDEANALQTPWFTLSYICEYCRDELIADIEANGYLFDEDGNQLPIWKIMRDGEKVTEHYLYLSDGLAVEVNIS